MVQDAVPDRSRAAAPNQGVLVTDAKGPNAWPCEQSEVSSIYFMPIRHIFLFFHSRVSRVLLFLFSDLCYAASGFIL
jgi:hypothetical protein